MYLNARPSAQLEKPSASPPWKEAGNSAQSARWPTLTQFRSMVRRNHTLPFGSLLQLQSHSNCVLVNITNVALHINSEIVENAYLILAKQGKKVFKSYCLPMLSLFSLYNAARAQKSKLVTRTRRSYSALLSTASAKGGRQ